MATHTAARRSHAQRHAALPRHARRVSGPIARPVPHVPAIPRPVRRGSTGAFERLLALPDLRLVDRLLRGRVWIWLIGILLGGIVAMQVSLLKLNTGISNAVTTSATLERVNADLETEVARLSSGERIQRTAAEEGMVAPAAGDVGYLTARPGRDEGLAVQRMQSPSDEAEQVMANGGRAPAGLAPSTVTQVVSETATAPAPTATVAPAPTVTPAPVPTATPDPLPPAATGTGTDPATGATTAPAG
jgi:cell division protein FtsL